MTFRAVAYIPTTKAMFPEVNERVETCDVRPFVLLMVVSDGEGCLDWVNFGAGYVSPKEKKTLDR